MSGHDLPPMPEMAHAVECGYCGSTFTGRLSQLANLELDHHIEAHHSEHDRIEALQRVVDHLTQAIGELR